MSLATFKKKSINRWSSATKISGKPPGGIWMQQGPYNNNKYAKQNFINYGSSGFSINGTHRSISVGADMKMSKSGTPFRGVHAIGWGGYRGHYKQVEPLLNAGAAKIQVMGNQWEFIKPSVLSTNGMLHKKYRWAYTGKYPNYWVQPNYTGDQTDTASQGVYIQNKTSQNDIWYDVNNTDMYINYYIPCNKHACKKPLTAPYTKTLYIPKASSAYTTYIQRKCVNPTPAQKPYPYAVQTGTGILTGGIKVSSVGNSGLACGTTNQNVEENTVHIPQWYITNTNSNTCSI